MFSDLYHKYQLKNHASAPAGLSGATPLLGAGAGTALMETCQGKKQLQRGSCLRPVPRPGHSLGVDPFGVLHEVLGHLESEAHGVVRAHGLHHAQLVVLQGDRSQHQLRFGSGCYSPEAPCRREWGSWQSTSMLFPRTGELGEGHGLRTRVLPTLGISNICRAKLAPSKSETLV